MTSAKDRKSKISNWNRIKLQDQFFFIGLTLFLKQIEKCIISSFITIYYYYCCCKCIRFRKHLMMCCLFLKGIRFFKWSTSVIVVCENCEKRHRKNVTIGTYCNVTVYCCFFNYHNINLLIINIFFVCINRTDRNSLLILQFYFLWKCYTYIYIIYRTWSHRTLRCGSYIMRISTGDTIANA